MADFYNPYSEVRKNLPPSNPLSTRQSTVDLSKLEQGHSYVSPSGQAYEVSPSGTTTPIRYKRSYTPPAGSGDLDLSVYSGSTSSDWTYGQSDLFNQQLQNAVLMQQLGYSVDIDDGQFIYERRSLSSLSPYGAYGYEPTPMMWESDYYRSQQQPSSWDYGYSTPAYDSYYYSGNGYQRYGGRQYTKPLYRRRRYNNYYNGYNDYNYGRY